MGPINDLIGVEQGGVNSDRVYKLCNNIQLNTAQRSQLGVDMDGVVVSSIGQADDTAQVANCLTKLAGLLHLAEEYCQSYHVELVPEKTKLLAFHPRGNNHGVYYIQELLNPLTLNGHRIGFSNSAEHVGVLSRAGKRGAARQHCCQKEIDKNISGRRILVKFTTVFEFLKTKFLLLQL